MEETKKLETNQIEQSWLEKIAFDLLIALGGSIFLALLSQVSIPLPFTPVPLTLQTFGVFILGGTLGGKRALMSIAAYLVQGTCGLPVFAGGLSNPLWLLDYKGGFLISFLPAAFFIGNWIRNKTHASFYYIVFSLAIGQLLIFAIGASWLAFYVGFVKAIHFGILPFLSGAGLKIIMAACSLKGIAFLRNRRSLCPK
ncbi:MAG TPA: biotin transporter BioY [Rhabdochlamydiaceae bacterium]|nr:biotin transporter BioY [Rhabdochlamydiaceae bacterium]